MTATSFANPSHLDSSSSLIERFRDDRRYQMGLGLSLVLLGIVLFIFAELSQPRFVVAPGDTLVDHLGYKRAIKTADRFGLPIYQGTPDNPRALVIDKKTALRADTNRFQVMVPVYAGDRFDLRTFGGSYRPVKARSVGNPSWRTR